jgi:hypothetical protein
MASYLIRKGWFSWPGASAGMTAVVPPSGVGPPQKSEAVWLASLGMLNPGTRTTQAAGAVTVGNVVSSTPAAGTYQPYGTPIAYIVAI